MACYLFQALLLLFSVVFCALCGAGSAGLVRFTAELFKRGSIDVLEPKGDEKERFDVLSVSLPSAVVCANGVMVVLVEEVQPDYKHGILTKYIGTEGDNWSDKAIEKNGKNWRAQLAFKSEKKMHIAFASVARGDSIYILSASDEMSAPPSPQRTTNTKAWDFKLTVGTITYGADAAGKRIEWRTKDVSDHFVTDIQEKLQGVVPFDGSAFLTEDGMLVFFVRAWNRATGEFFFVIAHSRDPNSDFSFTYVNTTAGCYSSFFSWGEQLFMVPLYYKGDSYKLQASNDMGETWKDLTGPLAEKLGDLTKKIAFFTPITIEGRRVLLFTKEEPASGASQRGNVNSNLYIADDNYSEKVGPFHNDVRDFRCRSFFYANDELFFLSFQDNYKVQLFFTPLKEQLEKIKLILKEWYPEDC